MACAWPRNKEGWTTSGEARTQTAATTGMARRPASQTTAGRAAAGAGSELTRLEHVRGSKSGCHNKRGPQRSPRAPAGGGEAEVKRVRRRRTVRGSGKQSRNVVASSRAAPRTTPSSQLPQQLPRTALASGSGGGLQLLRLAARSSHGRTMTKSSSFGLLHELPSPSNSNSSLLPLPSSPLNLVEANRD
jgi:hypothetical protein